MKRTRPSRRKRTTRRTVVIDSNDTMSWTQGGTMYVDNAVAPSQSFAISTSFVPFVPPVEEDDDSEEDEGLPIPTSFITRAELETSVSLGPDPRPPVGPHPIDYTGPSAAPAASPGPVPSATPGPVVAVPAAALAPGSVVTAVPNVGGTAAPGPIPTPAPTMSVSDAAPVAIAAAPASTPTGTVLESRIAGLTEGFAAPQITLENTCSPAARRAVLGQSEGNLKYWRLEKIIVFDPDCPPSDLKGSRGTQTPHILSDGKHVKEVWRCKACSAIRRVDPNITNVMNRHTNVQCKRKATPIDPDY
ncbi:hypothetical protein CF326_g4049 [Tilletia indica]|nr:hypothetical protein CF326_g4049 [Tilletia indica]